MEHKSVKTHKHMTIEQQKQQEKLLRQQQDKYQKELEQLYDKYKFRPQHPYAAFDCKCYATNYCSCGDRLISSSLFVENVHDVAVAVARVMVICGIHPCKANGAIEVIIEALMNYDEMRHRIDKLPTKRLRKVDIIHALGKRCMMSLMEASLSYAIIKRAFKAFYHGTTCNIKTVTPDRRVLHDEECFWLHAAVRTAQIFANFEGLFPSYRFNYEQQIKCVYKELLDRLKERTYLKLIQKPCPCRDCSNKTVKELKPLPITIKRSDGKIPAHLKDVPFTPYQFRDHIPVEKRCRLKCEQRFDIDTLLGAETNEDNIIRQDNVNDNDNAAMVPYPVHVASNQSIHVPRCYKCSCPKLVCECDIDKATGLLTFECSQGPYVCHWVRHDTDDEEPGDPCVPYPFDHVCPIDCDTASIELEECVCEDECDCLEGETEDWDLSEENITWDNESVEQVEAEMIEEEEPQLVCGCPFASSYPC